MIIKKIFSDVKWWEVVFVAISLIVIITLSVVYHSHVFYIISSTFGIIGVLFLSKVNVVGIMICIVQLIFYSIISYLNAFYGEIINNLCVTLPMYIVNLVVWLKNLFNKSGQVKINSAITYKEIVLAIFVVLILSVGMFFLLDYFNTNMILASTFSFACNTLAIYFLSRRSSINFVFYIFSNIANLVMWGTLIVTTNDLSMLITFLNIIVYFILNVYGLTNWIKTQKIQNRDVTFDIIKNVLKENF